MKLTINSSPEVVQFYIKKAQLTQTDLADEHNVTPQAVSKAIKKIKGMGKLRSQIIESLNQKLSKAA